MPQTVLAQLTVKVQIHFLFFNILNFSSYDKDKSLGLASAVFNSCKDDADDDKGKGQPDPTTIDAGVVINGVKWATRNIAAHGHFADKPEDAGMFYQWNRKTAWSAENETVENWDNTIPAGTEWKKSNDPSPAGWRVPTYEELQTLINTAKVSNDWTTQNGVNGIKFTDLTTENTLFLPFAGCRTANVDENGLLKSVGISGFYWSSTQNGESGAYRLVFNSVNNAIYLMDNTRIGGYSVRPVAE